MSQHPISRRNFGKALVAGLAGSCALAKLADATATDAPSGTQPSSDAPDFTVVVLGDTHFDRLAHHDMDWLRREKAGDIHQVENYSRIATDVLPKLLAEVRGQVTGSTVKVPFILHLGDLVEGLCGTEALARRQCEEAVEQFSAEQLGAPMVLTKGNHDITGPGAVSAFDNIVRPAMAHAGIERVAKQSGGAAGGASFVLRQGQCWFVVFDAYAPGSMEWLEESVADHAPEHGPMVFVIHPPVVPYTARCWHVFGSAAQAAQRARLLNVLARHRAVVLNGHLHRYGLLRRAVGDVGYFDQLSLVSIVPTPDVKPRDERAGDDYGPELTTLEPRFSINTLDRRKVVLATEKPFVSRYEEADLPGYALLHVRGGTVTADIHRGVGQAIWKRLVVNARA